MQNHSVVRASAGTGKTYQLTELFCHLVLEQGLKPQQIVTLTFTRKAAAELRERIAQRLGESWQWPLQMATLSNFHGAALQHLQQYVGSHLSASLLSDKGADFALFEQACLQAWFVSQPNAGLREAVKRANAFWPVGSDLVAMLWQALQKAREEHCLDFAKIWQSYHPQKHQLQLHSALLQLRQQLLASMPVLQGNSKQKLQAFAEAGVPAVTLPGEQFINSWQQVFALIDRRGKLGEIYSKAQQEFVEEKLTWLAGEYFCAHHLADAQALVEAAWQTYEQHKKNQCLLDFADLLEQAVALFERDAQVHTQLRQNIAAVLLDEAQDTNALQNQYVALLCGFCGPAQHLPVASLHVVGDWKQAIYTFRGASPHSFATLRDMVQLRGGIDKTLQQSYRSQPKVVALINHLGQSIFSNDYEMLTAAKPDKPQDLVGGIWLEVSSPATFSKPQAIATGAVFQVQQWLEQGAAPQQIAVLLPTMLQASRLLQALQRANIPAIMLGGGGLYDQSGVKDWLHFLAWLCDPCDELAASVALTSPILALTTETWVALLTSAVAKPCQQLHAGVLPIAELEVSPAQADWLARLNTALPKLVAAAKTHEVMVVAELCEAMLGYRQRYLQIEPDGAMLGHIDAFLSLAVGKRAPEFVAAQKWCIARGIAEPIRASWQSQAVLISSVHQSKGLEYDYVLLPYLEAKGRSETAVLRFDRNLGLVFAGQCQGKKIRSEAFAACLQREQHEQTETLRRLLYVAVTRAKTQVGFVALASDASCAKLQGFAQFLYPWWPQALADGVLTHRCFKVETAAPWQQAV